MSHKQSNALRFLFSHLVKERKSPCFEVSDSRSIEIITDPVDYYLALHKLIEQSQQRISMSALYLGTGKLEEFLLEKIDR
jgi:phosphatidylserine/phosphatidylglycerophosphate/cardiolipin synthase-like enzyme